jgi:branched-chain amino acid transport system permease protein
MRFNQIGLAVLVVGLFAFPPFALAIDEPFYITLLTRLLIFALAASSLNLILGYGGMVSFGHAAFFGVGGYVIGILAQNGVFSVWVGWPLALVVTALLGLVIGAISLRTRSVYFIMITLAFAQMLFFLFNSLRAYGGQDGISFDRSVIGVGIDLTDGTVFYYVVLVLMLSSLYLIYRVIHSRFGHVLQSIKANESRMAAIGYPVYRYKLVGFVIGAALAGLAGVLNANLNTFISPNSLAWPLSGQMMMMVILGGVGRFWGGTIGAFAFILIETVLESYTIYWQFGLGVALLLIVLMAPGGISGLVHSAVTRLQPAPKAPASTPDQVAS